MRGSALIGISALNLCALRFRRFMRICWSMRNYGRGQLLSEKNFTLHE